MFSDAKANGTFAGRSLPQFDTMPGARSRSRSPLYLLGVIFILGLQILFPDRLNGAESLTLTSSKPLFMAGYSNFHNKQQLPTIEPVRNDIKQLGKTFVKSQEFDVTEYKPEFGVTQFSAIDSQADRQNSPSDGFKTEYDRFISHFREYLSNLPDTTELLIVYISTHGDLDDQGLYHLALSDTQVGPDGSMQNSLPYDTLFKELCGLQHDVVLVLDACFSGAANLPNNPPEIGAVNNDNRLIVMTASRRSETAGFFQEQSCYSYWLNQGLLGYADTIDVDGVITVDELHCYCLKHMDNMPIGYRPMKFVLGANQNSELVGITPSNWDEMIQNLAERINIDLRNYCEKNGVAANSPLQVKVLDFQPSPIARQQGFLFESKGKEIAQQLSRRLNALSKGNGARYTVADYQTTQDDSKRFVAQNQNKGAENMVKQVLVRERARNVNTFVTTGEIAPLSSDGDRTTTSIRVLTGRSDQPETISEMAGRAYEVCVSSTTAFETQPVCIPPTIIVPANPMLPARVRAVPPSAVLDNMFIAPTIGLNDVPDEIAENKLCVPEIRVKLKGTPPIPFDLTAQAKHFCNNYEARDLKYGSDGRLFLSLERDEEFIIVLNINEVDDNALAADPAKKKPYLFVRVLVDGRNTLPFGINYELDRINPLRLIKKEQLSEKSLVSLEEAQPWYLESARPMVVPGFVPIRRQGEPNRCYPFVMTDQNPGVGNRPLGKDFVGQILIALYKPAIPGKHRSGIVMGGEDQPIEIKTIATDYRPVELIGTYCISYAEPKQVDKLLK